MTPMRVLLVALGGMIGTAARTALALVIPAAPLPWAVLVANLAGAFLLGALTARLPRTELRLFLGTGMLGGFTTYSALTVGTLELWQTTPGVAALYLCGSVVLGLAAAAFGLWLARPRGTRG